MAQQESPFGPGTEANPNPAENVVESYHHSTEATKHAQDRTQLMTTERREIWVDPSSGDDSNAGTESNPIQSLAEMFGRLAIHGRHRQIVYLKEGTHATPPNDERGPPRIFTGADYQSDQNPLTITKAPTASKSNVIIDGVIGLGATTSELEKASIKDITITGTLLNKNGQFRVENVDFVGGASDILSDSNGRTVAFDSHDAGATVFSGCDFSGVDIAMKASQGHTLLPIGCSGLTDSWAVSISNGATLNEQGFNSLNGALGYVEYDNGASRNDNFGQFYSGDVTLSDGFEDGRFQDRRPDPRGGFRPSWGVNSGSPTVSKGAVTLPAGDTTTQEIIINSKTATGVFTLEYSLSGSPTTGTFNFNAIYEDGANYIAATLLNDATVDLLMANGSYNSVGSGTYPDDTATHTIDLTRSEDIDGNGNAGASIDIDGSQEVLATNSFVPQVDKLTLKNGFDVAVDIEFVQAALP